MIKHIAKSRMNKYEYGLNCCAARRRVFAARSRPSAIAKFLLCVLCASAFIVNPRTCFAQQQTPSRFDIAFNRFYDYDEYTEILKKLVAAYPELLNLAEQVDLSFLYPVTPNWSIVGRYYYSLGDDRRGIDAKLIESIAGVQWESCCMAVRLVARRYIRERNGDLDDSLRLEFELKGLGSAGQKTEDILSRAILGYDRDDLYLVPPSSLDAGDLDNPLDPIP